MPEKKAAVWMLMRQQAQWDLCCPLPYAEFDFAQRERVSVKKPQLLEARVFWAQQSEALGKASQLGYISINPTEMLESMSEMTAYPYCLTSYRYMCKSLTL